MQRKFTELEQVRRDKLKQLKDMGVNPFSRQVSHNHNASYLIKNYGQKSREELQVMEMNVVAVGRISAFRGPFIVFNDSSGQLQGYIAKDEFPKVAQIVKLLDLGDHIRFSGTLMKTKTGTLTIRVQKIDVLSKSLKPLPEKWHGLKDVEERYRRRYIDLIANPLVKDVFWIRSKIISLIRRFFDELDYMEVETPILQPILGGALARPFTTHHNALDMPFYLRIATELPLKKLLVGGIDRVYEIGRIFRNEGIDTTHNPEFTTIEFYEAYSNLAGMIKRTEAVISFVAKELKKEEISFKGEVISLRPPFRQINMTDSVNDKTGLDFRSITFDDAKKAAAKHKVAVEPYYQIGHIIEALFEELVEKELVQPTFVVGHPIEISPLAAKNEKDGRFTDRAELFILGKEYANMFTELNDPIDQLERFEAQHSEAQKGNDEASEIDYDFIEALEQGMPPAGGCGIGIDRLTMLLTGKESIREVLLFPHLKNKNN